MPEDAVQTKSTDVWNKSMFFEKEDEQVGGQHHGIKGSHGTESPVYWKDDPYRYGNITTFAQEYDTLCW